MTDGLCGMYSLLFRENAGVHTVLYVDDEPGIRKLVMAMLESGGFSVLLATSAEDALALLKGSRRVDILVTDIVMPGMGGIELIEEVRRGFPALPVCCVTGYVDRFASDRLGAVPVIIKPFTSRELIQTVRRILMPGRGTNSAV